jgi:hypothetical protein
MNGATPAGVSIVVPTLNEAARIGPLVATLSAEAPPVEIVVADGGSVDFTADIARAAGARVVPAPRGRGQQLAAGIAASTGDIVWMVHADTTVPPGAVAALRRALADPAVAGGNFALVFAADGDDDRDRAFARWLTGFYAWFRRRGLYYGDSGIFIRRAALDRLGGVKPIALMEDFDLSRRMERAGGTVCVDAPALVTSARRFAGRRPAAIVAGWVLVHALWYLGARPSFIARVYRSAVAAPGRNPAQATGAQSTSSMRAAPVASMTSRSKPRAMPAHSPGSAATAARKSSSTG